MLTYAEEVVPDSLQFPRVLERGLRLDDAREDSDEEWRAEVARVDLLVLEVVVQVG